jgi:putative endonuclease
MSKPYCLYLLRCSDNSLYTGITNDLPKRLAAHRSGRGAQYTRGRRPLALVYTEPCRSKGKALKREAQIKRWPRRKKEALFAAAILLLATFLALAAPTYSQTKQEAKPVKQPSAQTQFLIDGTLLEGMAASKPGGKNDIVMQSRQALDPKTGKKYSVSYQSGPAGTVRSIEEISSAGPATAAGAQHKFASHEAAVAAFSGLKAGMAAKEVEAIMGPPTRKEADAWIYVFDAIAPETGVVAFGKMLLNGEQEGRVLFKAGKVERTEMKSLTTHGDPPNS